jgi:Domain of unknown function (DUF4189)
MGRSGSFLSLLRLPAALALAATLLMPHPSAADAAVAVGVPPDVSKSGYAYGRNINNSSMEEAKERALYNCHTAKDASEDARRLCIVVMTFRDQCVSVALDPQAGTPGAGWAVAPTKEAAESQAMAQCIATAGPNRRDSCKTSDSACDSR